MNADGPRRGAEVTRIGGALAVIVVAVALVWWWEGRRGATGSTHATVDIPAHEIEGATQPGELIEQDYAGWESGATVSVLLGPVATTRAMVVGPEGLRGRDGMRTSPRLLDGGVLRVADAPDGTTMLLWDVPLERYVCGAVGAEMGPAAPAEALRAQAIASRTWAMRALAKPLHPALGAHLEIGERAQGYSAAAGRAASVRAAVEATRGAHLADDMGAPALTPFHACCGGHTSSPSVAWTGSPSPPHLRAMPMTRGAEASGARSVPPLAATEEAALGWIASPPTDAWCSPRAVAGVPSYASGDFRWRREFSPADAARLGIASWRAVERGAGGHIAALQTPAGALRGDLAIRRHVAPALPSTCFVWDVRPDGSAVITGAGHGHGVGMCQSCAMAMAATGRPHEAILAAFYAPARVMRGR